MAGSLGLSLRPARRRRRLTRALYAGAGVMFAAGVCLLVGGYLSDHQAEQHYWTAVADSTVPSETKPGSVDSYQVAPDLPRTLSIPAIGVDARVLQLGVTADNALATPANIFDTGWYTGSAKPGDKTGAMLIDAHVSGPTQHGVFYTLKKLNTGDTITVERGDGTMRSFVVTRTKTVRVADVDMTEALRSDDPGKLGLTLITCGGSFDVSSNEFQSRVLVFAVAT